MRNIVKTVFISSMICLLGFSVDVQSNASRDSKILKREIVGYICHKVRRGQVKSLIDFLEDAEIYMDSMDLYSQIQCVDSGNDVDNLLLTAVKSKKEKAVKYILKYMKRREKLTNNPKLLYQILNASNITNDKPILDWTREQRKLSKNNRIDVKYYTKLEKLFREFGARECAQYDSKRTNVCNRWTRK